MASIGEIIFWSMIVLIFVCAGLIILLLAIAFSVSKGTVESSNPFPVGNLGEDVILECMFLSKSGSGSGSGSISGSNVLITWEKESLTGLVYQYNNNAAQLQQQNSQFSDRVQLFTDAIASGNASLLMRSVRTVDQGVYHCSVSAPGVSGTASIDLRVTVYSAPNFTISKNGLIAEAPRWQSRPNVTWLDKNGMQLNSNTQFTSISSDIVQVVSNLSGPLTSAEIYTCSIKNSFIQSISEVTGDGILKNSYFVTSSSPEMLPLRLLSTVSFLFYFLVW
ncbi:V-set domain-containing T-cell activation inhibitor 1 [Hoplias malabaricus]|uniref:V-set domain-containing T-cell activation inhibitor 1 n=1 Tax=Hoplias malabaricus TaxID=27720 RepID=UPI003463800D